MTDLDKNIHIAIVAYPDVLRSAALGLADLFSIANRYGEKYNMPKLNYVEISLDEIHIGQGFDVVILPPSLSSQAETRVQTLNDWLIFQHDQGAVLCSICAGVFWLGRAGLLDGRNVTTHWFLADEVQQKFPKIIMDAEHILIDDHDIVTAGGLMAWIDLGLFIVSKYLGGQITSDTARHLLIDTSGREQKNYRSFRPNLTHGDAAILKVQHWLEGHFGDGVNVAEMIHLSGYSERTFLRKFKAATNCSPNGYIQNLRVEKARGFLERTSLSINEIAWRVGYQDVSAFSRVFKDVTGLQAGRYRERFKV